VLLAWAWWWFSLLKKSFYEWVEDLPVAARFRVAEPRSFGFELGAGFVLGDGWSLPVMRLLRSLLRRGRCRIEFRSNLSELCGVQWVRSPLADFVEAFLFGALFLTSVQLSFGVGDDTFKLVRGVITGGICHGWQVSFWVGLRAAGAGREGLLKRV
jgi:hypothetical protein